MSNSFRELIVWQRAKSLAIDIYVVTKNFPDDERFGLTSQMRRAAVSIAANIAEGQGRSTAGEFNLFLGHARGSLLELQSHLEIATELGLVAEVSYKDLLLKTGEVGFLLNRLKSSLHKKSSAGSSI